MLKLIARKLFNVIEIECKDTALAFNICLTSLFWTAYYVTGTYMGLENIKKDRVFSPARQTIFKEKLRVCVVGGGYYYTLKYYYVL